MNSAKRGGPGRGFWLALGLIAVLGLGALGYVASRPKIAARTIDPNLPPMKAEGYLIGSPSAPLEVIEFGDFECPGCGQFATVTEPDIRTNLVNTGKIRFRFMDFPLPMHRNTWDASLAASCANDQGKFWQMHDALFQNQDRWNGEATGKPRTIMRELAQGLGLDMSKYDACMDSEQHRAQIQANLEEGERRQVNSTPTFVIGTRMVPGALYYDQFKQLVDEELAKLPAKPDSAKAGASATEPAAGAATSDSSAKPAAR